MTDCSTTRDWILETDLEELEHVRSHVRSEDREQDTAGTHARHLAECAECGALADEILGAEVVLRDGLDSVEPALGVETALVRAREAHEAGEFRRATDRRRGVPVAIGVAAAAAIGGVLLMSRPSPTSVDGFDPATVSAARALGLVGPGPLVKAGSDDRVAILPTENPNITVIWFME